MALAGCGDPETSGDTATKPRSKNTKTVTPTETETPTPTEEPYPGHRYVDEIEERIRPWVFSVLEVSFDSSAEVYEVHYQTAKETLSGRHEQIARIIGTMAYMVDHGKAGRDWDCSIYYNVEGSMKLFATYTISVQDVVAYVGGKITAQELLDRTLATIETADY